MCLFVRWNHVWAFFSHLVPCSSHSQAYAGAVPNLSNRLLPATAGLLGAEAYHAGSARSRLADAYKNDSAVAGVPVYKLVDALSSLRGRLSCCGVKTDGGLLLSPDTSVSGRSTPGAPDGATLQVAPLSADHALAFSRTFDQARGHQGALVVGGCDEAYL